MVYYVTTLSCELPTPLRVEWPFWGKTLYCDG